MSLAVLDADALRALVAEEIARALEPVLAALARDGGTRGDVGGDGYCPPTRSRNSCASTAGRCAE